jgi:hypothetical protein
VLVFRLRARRATILCVAAVTPRRKGLVYILVFFSLGRARPLSAAGSPETPQRLRLRNKIDVDAA